MLVDRGAPVTEPTANTDAPGWFDHHAPEVAVVIPCFNESHRMHAESFLALTEDPEVSAIFVDDGSTDDTLGVLDAIQAAAPRQVEVMRAPKNLGKAGAVALGMRAASKAGATWIGYLDADLAVPVAEWTRLTAARTDAVDGVLASRVRLLGRHIDRKPVRHLMGRGFATFASLLLHIPVYDTQCGAKLFRAGPPLDAALATPFETRWLFDVELIARLLYPDDPSLAVPGDRLIELPLERWTDVPDGALAPSSIPSIAAEVVALTRDVQRRRKQRR